MPSDDATDWITPNWAGDVLQRFQPFGRVGVFEVGKAGGVAARTRQAVDEAGADRVGDKREHDRNGPGRLQQRRYGTARLRQDDLWGERDQVRRVPTQVVGISTSKAVLDPDVVADGPARLLETLRKCRQSSLSFRIVRREID